MELHNPMMCHQSRLPLFAHVVRPAQRRLKRKANNPVYPALKSEKKSLVNEVNKATLEVACNQNTPEVVNLQLQPIISDAKMMRDVEVSQPLEAVRQPVNFKFKNSYHVVKPNVFGNIKRGKKTPVINKTQLDRDITALLKRIRTEVENELLNKSATSSIQNIKKEVVKLDKPTFPQEQSKTANKPTVPEYESKAVSQNGKTNHNLDKQIYQPGVSHIGIQTDPDPEFPNLAMSRSIDLDIARLGNFVL
ncbi:hypothetical protein PYW08_009836 [Mythimna loreyi]|uniref:Uncharacterized protein n=1 Tax=Mythimna loreyi TaxID=667449 RepID=A0ACC2Q7K3_9NEOP|nr:hypothetical protein PYW08_009836 [Mythimna loreyi]